MTTMQTNDGSRYSLPSNLTTAGAIIAGSAAQNIPSVALLPISHFAINKMRKLNENIDTVQLKKAAKEIINHSPELNKKGVKLYSFTTKKNLTLNEVITNWATKYIDVLMNKLAPAKKYIKPSTVGNNFMMTQIRHGYNAGFNPATNGVCINFEKMGTSVFHEIGHAINFNSSKFWRGMQKARLPFMLIAMTLPTIALFKRKKAEGEEPKNIFDKATTFIKENVGKLTTLAFVPIVAEELKASARGNKLAKGLLKPDLYKRVVKSNRLGAATYIAAAIASGVGAYLANKVRDKIASPEKIA